MHKPLPSVSLADLSAAGVRLRPYEAATVVREITLQLARGEIAGVPSPHVVRLSSQGQLSVEGPVETGGQIVARAAQLLDSLLPDAEAGREFRVPGALKLVVARAQRTIDLPPFPSLEAFADALERFAATDPAAAFASLAAMWNERAETTSTVSQAPAAAARGAAQVEPFAGARLPGASGELTISDIRRARRATGISLAEVSDRSRIPVGLLRQLEWGYFANWPRGFYARAQLVRYARAARLDEQLVVSTVLPLMEASPAPAALMPRPPAALAVVEDPLVEVEITHVPQPEPAAARERRRRSRVLAALAVPALVALGVLPLLRSGAEAPVTVAPGPVAEQSAVTKGSATAPPAADPSHAPVADPSPAPAAGGTDAPEAGTDTSARATAVAENPVPPAPQAEARATSGNAPEPDAAPEVAAPVSVLGMREPPPAQDASYTLAAEAAYSPSFAAAGSAMFYHAQEVDRAALVRADTDSSGAVLRITRIVDDNANNFHVRPSPDGTRIAFDSDREGLRAVYVADADGRNVRRVSPDGFAAVPSWSPDGTTLAFVRAEADRPRVWNVWTLRLDTGELHQVTRHRVGQPWGGSWFPDGRRLAYSHEDRLIVHDLDTGRQRVFPSPRKGRLVRTPAVSPDGQRVMFQLYRDGAWMLELRDGSMRRILDDPTAEEYTWSPDGQRVAYHSRRSGAWGVWVMAKR